MLGSFMFALGAYITALSIFEAPRMFRRHLVIVTSSYMFGGLFFVAGTMGYVAAFEPNYELKVVATWFYLVGCLFYVNGTFLSFVHIVARRQVHWERIQKDDSEKKKKKIAKLLSRVTSALPRVLKARKKSKRANSLQNEIVKDEVDLDNTSDLGDLEEGLEDISLDATDINIVQKEVTEQLAIALGSDMSRELLAVVGEGEIVEEEDNLFGAFWRSVTGVGTAPSDESDGKENTNNDAVLTETICAPATDVLGASDKDDLGLIYARAG